MFYSILAICETLKAFVWSETESLVGVINAVVSSRPGGPLFAAVPAAEALCFKGSSGPAVSSGQTQADPLPTCSGGHRTQSQW